MQRGISIFIAVMAVAHLTFAPRQTAQAQRPGTREAMDTATQQGIETWWAVPREAWDSARDRGVNVPSFYFGALSDDLAAARLQEFFARKNGKAFSALTSADLCIIFHGILRTTAKGGPWRLSSATVADEDFPEAAAAYVERHQRIAERVGVADRIWWQVADEARRNPKSPETIKAADVLFAMVKAIKQRVPKARILCVCWPTPEILPYLDAVAYPLVGKPYPGTTTRINSIPTKIGYLSGGFDSYLAGTQAGYVAELRQKLEAAGLRRALFYKWDEAAAQAWMEANR